MCMSLAECLFNLLTCSAVLVANHDQDKNGKQRYLIRSSFSYYSRSRTMALEMVESCRTTVEDEGAAYAFLWSVKGDKITPTEHYVTPERRAYLKTLRGDDKNFGSASHGIEFAKNESAVGRDST